VDTAVRATVWESIRAQLKAFRLAMRFSALRPMLGLPLLGADNLDGCLHQKVRLV
jgi:hypothetical protein